MLRSIIAVFALTGFACSSAAASELGERSLRAMDRADTLVQQRIAEWDASGSDCDSEHPTAAMAVFRSAESLSATLFQRAQREQVQVLRRNYMADHEAVAIRAISLRLTLADANLAHGCADAADALYRDAISTYTGGAYASYRERARIGVDDVRALKQKVGNQ